MIENKTIQNTIKQLAENCTPVKIYLVSNKVSTDGELTSFKLALIVPNDTESISELECQLYMKVDSELPYDLVLYKVSEWDTLKSEIGTFAWKINNSGAVVYG